MKLFINAGFAEPLNTEVAKKCQSVANGIRTAIAVNDEHPMVATLVEDALTYFDEAVFIVAGWDWRKEDGSLVQRRDADLWPLSTHLANQCQSLIAEWGSRGGDTKRLWIEIGNELDGSYWKTHLNSYHRVAMVCYDRIRSISQNVQVVTGSTMNFNKEALWRRGGYEVFRDICALSWPKDTIQGLHPYRGGGRFWPSFDSDQEALGEIQRLIGTRRLAITEMAWASGTTHPDESIAAMTRDEIAMWRGFGAACYVQYQIQDSPAPNNTGEHGFGVCSNVVDGLVEKPVASVLREAMA